MAVTKPKIWIPPYIRVDEDGSIQHVDGYWRELKAGEKVPSTTKVQGTLPKSAILKSDFPSVDITAGVTYGEAQRLLRHGSTEQTGKLSEGPSGYITQYLASGGEETVGGSVFGFVDRPDKEDIVPTNTGSGGGVGAVGQKLAPYQEFLVQKNDAGEFITTTDKYLTVGSTFSREDLWKEPEVTISQGKTYYGGFSWDKNTGKVDYGWSSNGDVEKVPARYIEGKKFMTDMGEFAALSDPGLQSHLQSLVDLLSKENLKNSKYSKGDKAKLGKIRSVAELYLKAGTLARRLHENDPTLTSEEIDETVAELNKKFREKEGYYVPSSIQNSIPWVARLAPSRIAQDMQGEAQVYSYNLKLKSLGIADVDTADRQYLTDLLKEKFPDEKPGTFAFLTTEELRGWTNAWLDKPGGYGSKLSEINQFRQTAEKRKASADLKASALSSLAEKNKYALPPVNDIALAEASKSAKKLATLAELKSSYTVADAGGITSTTYTQNEDGTWTPTFSLPDVVWWHGHAQVVPKGSTFYVYDNPALSNVGPWLYIVGSDGASGSIIAANGNVVPLDTSTSVSTLKEGILNGGDIKVDDGTTTAHVTQVTAADLAQDTVVVSNPELDGLVTKYVANSLADVPDGTDLTYVPEKNKWLQHIPGKVGKPKHFTAMQVKSMLDEYDADSTEPAGTTGVVIPDVTVSDSKALLKKYKLSSGDPATSWKEFFEDRAATSGWGFSDIKKWAAVVKWESWKEDKQPLDHISNTNITPFATNLGLSDEDARAVMASAYLEARDMPDVSISDQYHNISQGPNSTQKMWTEAGLGDIKPWLKIWKAGEDGGLSDSKLAVLLHIDETDVEQFKAEAIEGGKPKYNAATLVPGHYPITLPDGSTFYVAEGAKVYYYDPGENSYPGGYQAPTGTDFTDGWVWVESAAGSGLGNIYDKQANSGTMSAEANSLTDIEEMMEGGSSGIHEFNPPQNVVQPMLAEPITNDVYTLDGNADGSFDLIVGTDHKTLHVKPPQHAVFLGTGSWAAPNGNDATGSWVFVYDDDSLESGTIYTPAGSGAGTPMPSTAGKSYAPGNLDQKTKYTEILPSSSSVQASTTSGIVANPDGSMDLKVDGDDGQGEVVHVLPTQTAKWFKDPGNKSNTGYTDPVGDDFSNSWLFVSDPNTLDSGWVYPGTGSKKLFVDDVAETYGKDSEYGAYVTVVPQAPPTVQSDVLPTSWQVMPDADIGDGDLPHGTKVVFHAESGKYRVYVPGKVGKPKYLTPDKVEAYLEGKHFSVLDETPAVTKDGHVFAEAEVEEEAASPALTTDDMLEIVTSGAAATSDIPAKTDYHVHADKVTDLINTYTVNNKLPTLSYMKERGASYVDKMDTAEILDWLRFDLAGDEIAKYALESSLTKKHKDADTHPGSPDSPSGKLAYETLYSLAQTRPWGPSWLAATSPDQWSDTSLASLSADFNLWSGTKNDDSSTEQELLKLDHEELVAMATPFLEYVKPPTPEKVEEQNEKKVTLKSAYASENDQLLYHPESGYYMLESNGNVYLPEQVGTFLNQHQDFVAPKGATDSVDVPENSGNFFTSKPDDVSSQDAWDYVQAAGELTTVSDIKKVFSAYSPKDIDALVNNIQTNGLSYGTYGYPFLNELPEDVPLGIRFLAAVASGQTQFQVPTTSDSGNPSQSIMVAIQWQYEHGVYDQPVPPGAFGNIVLPDGSSYVPLPGDKLYWTGGSSSSFGVAAPEQVYDPKTGTNVLKPKPLKFAAKVQHKDGSATYYGPYGIIAQDEGSKMNFSDWIPPTNDAPTAPSGMTSEAAYEQYNAGVYVANILSEEQLSEDNFKKLWDTVDDRYVNTDFNTVNPQLSNDIQLMDDVALDKALTDEFAKHNIQALAVKLTLDNTGIAGKKMLLNDLRSGSSFDAEAALLTWKAKTGVLGFNQAPAYFDSHAPYTKLIAAGTPTSDWPNSTLQAFVNAVGLKNDQGGILDAYDSTTAYEAQKYLTSQIEPVSITEWKALQGKEAAEGALATVQPIEFSIVSKQSSKYGGSHTKWELRDQYGREWMGKPFASDPDAQARVEAEHYASQIGTLYGFGSPPTRAEVIDGTHVIVQLILPSKKGQKDLQSTSPASLTDEQLELAADEHILDWIVSNHDSNGVNIMLSPDGRPFGIDKGQAWKFFPEDKLAVGYNGGGAGFPQNPWNIYYNEIYGGIIDHSISEERAQVLAKKVILRALKVQRRSDAQYRKYVEAAMANRDNFPNGMTREQFVEAIVERKQHVAEDFYKLYQGVFEKAGYEWPLPPIEELGKGKLENEHGTVYVGISDDLLDSVSRNQIHGEPAFFAGDDIERGYMLLSEEKVGGTTTLVGSLKLLEDADKRVTTWIQAHKVEGVGGTPVDIPKPVGLPPTPPSAKGPTLFMADTVFGAIKTAAITVNKHQSDGEYNQGTLNNLATEGSALQAMKNAVEEAAKNQTGPVSVSGFTFMSPQHQKAWLEMADQYLADIKTIQDAKEAGAKTYTDPNNKFFSEYVPPDLTQDIPDVYDEGVAKWVGKDHNSNDIALIKLADGQYTYTSYGTYGTAATITPQVAKNLVNAYQLKPTTIIPGPDPAVALWANGDNDWTVKATKNDNTGGVEWVISGGSGAAHQNYQTWDGSEALKVIADHELAPAQQDSLEVDGQSYTVVKKKNSRAEGVFDPDTGTLQVSGESSVGTPGYEYEIQMGDDITIDYRPWQGLNIPPSQQGGLRISVKNYSSPEKFQTALDLFQKMGVDLTPADESSLELLYWKQVQGTIDQRIGWDSTKAKALKEYLSNNIVEGMSDEAQLEVYRKAMGQYFTPEIVAKADYMPHLKHYRPQNPTETSGLPFWWRPDVTPLDALKKGVIPKHVHHTTDAKNLSNSIAKSGGFVSTEERQRLRGAWIGGWSSPDDQQAGSASYVFSDLNYWSSYGGATTGFMPWVGAELATYANGGDTMGALAKRRSSAPFEFDKMMQKSGEMMIPDTASVLDDLLGMEVGNRAEVIAWFKAQGIVSIRGIPIEDFFVPWGGNSGFTEAQAKANLKLAIAWIEQHGMDDVVQLTPEAQAKLEAILT